MERANRRQGADEDIVVDVGQVRVRAEDARQHPKDIWRETVVPDGQRSGVAVLQGLDERGVVRAGRTLTSHQPHAGVGIAGRAVEGWRAHGVSEHKSSEGAPAAHLFVWHPGWEFVVETGPRDRLQG